MPVIYINTLRLKKEQELVRRDSEPKGSVLKEESRDTGTLQIALKVAPAAISRRETVFHDFAERVCTSYTTFMRP